MGWKFWQRNDKNDPSKIKLPKPKEIPDSIGRYLVVQKKMDPNLVWALKCALKPNAQSKTRFDFRVFSDKTTEKEGVTVVNYASLDAHPTLIVLQGQFDKGTNQVDVQE
jgi:hypothetical protein